MSAGTYGLSTYASQVVFGLAQGGIYALIALGYTLVYGILFMINFAHGEIFMGGTYIGFFVVNAFAQSGFLTSHPVLALLITVLTAMLTSVTLAVGLERIAYRPLRRAPRLVPLITAIGASLFLQYAFRGLFGTGVKVYPDTHLYLAGIDLMGGRYTVGGVVVRPIYFVVFFLAVALMLALYLFVQKSKMGKAMRAVAEDKDTAALMGIDVDRVIVMTFVLGAALAGAAGVMYALYNKQVTHTMGFIPGIKAFTAAVLGGIGNVPGAMLGGFFLGLAESTFPTLLGLDAQLKDVIAFGLLVLVLIFRPTGILGEVLSGKRA
ncbi:MAG: branched-chain amino acid ABC transporter permease [Anaerolineae bacterium]|nr:branched-chain amino acid ABC transporter permease [Anaerolineae bacterium]